MKPFRIFIFGLSVFLVVIILSVLFSGKKPNIFGFFIKIPSFEQFASASKPAYKDISHIIQLTGFVTDSVSAIPKTDTAVILHDTLKQTLKVTAAFRKPLIADSVRSVLRKIEFPPNSDTLLFPFFDELRSLSENKKLIRILHYGDSQIEGDRITSYLRNQLQARFGGSGVGLLPVVSISASSLSYLYNISDNWVRFSPLQSSTSEPKHKRYGALVSFARIVPNASLFSKNKDLEGWIELTHTNIAYPLSQQFQQCRIFYGYNKSPMMVVLKQNQTVLDDEIVPASSSLKELRWELASPKDLKITFRTNDPPDVYGIALDALHGVAVDNVSLRGSSGLEFTKMDLNFLKDFYSKLNVRLLILQFGVNVVPNITRNFESYERNLYRQLTTLKETIPGLAIILIGVSDVSRNGGNGFETKPNVENIRDAQKHAAFAAGCAFWDIFEAMGGRNSMPSWVYANPPLAQKDFVHFSPLGAKIVGEMFYRSFIYEYNQFIESRRKACDVSAVAGK